MKVIKKKIRRKEEGGKGARLAGGKGEGEKGRNGEWRDLEIVEQGEAFLFVDLEGEKVEVFEVLLVEFVEVGEVGEFGWEYAYSGTGEHIAKVVCIF